MIGDGDAERLVQSKGFDNNDACYYWVEALPSTPVGDFIYVNFFALENVETFVSIKPAIDELS